MASDNLMAMEQSWMYRPTFADAWLSDVVFNKETETLSKALQKSFTASNDGGDLFSAELVESLLNQPDFTPSHTPTASGGSEELEFQIPKQQARRNLPPSGRVTKRKSRASKRATTTFITADPANFRQMVQQVTGVRFSGGEIPALMRPEPQRMMFNPTTLDTSSFFGDGLNSGYVSQIPQPPMISGGGGAAVGGGGEFVGDGYCSFPTLESFSYGGKL